MQAYQLQYLQQMQMQYGLKVGLDSYFIEREDQLINNHSFQSQDQEFLMLMQAQAQAQQHQQEVHKYLKSWISYFACHYNMKERATKSR